MKSFTVKNGLVGENRKFKIRTLKLPVEEGLEQGRKEECFKNAKKMKQAGIAFDVIAQVTGLSIGEIASL